jgi:hypothetical protein
MLKRLLKRGETSGRVDDNMESIKKRFETFKITSFPVIQHFERLGKVRRVACDQGPDAVYASTRETVIAAMESIGVTEDQAKPATPMVLADAPAESTEMANVKNSQMPEESSFIPVSRVALATGGVATAGAAIGTYLSSEKDDQELASVEREVAEPESVVVPEDNIDAVVEENVVHAETAEESVYTEAIEEKLHSVAVPETGGVSEKVEEFVEEELVESEAFVETVPEATDVEPVVLEKEITEFANVEDSEMPEESSFTPVSRVALATGGVSTAGAAIGTYLSSEKDDQELASVEREVAEPGSVVVSEDNIDAVVEENVVHAETVEDSVYTEAIGEEILHNETALEAGSISEKVEEFAEEELVESEAVADISENLEELAEDNIIHVETATEAVAISEGVEEFAEDDVVHAETATEAVAIPESIEEIAHEVGSTQAVELGNEAAEFEPVVLQKEITEFANVEDSEMPEESSFTPVSRVALATGGVAAAGAAVGTYLSHGENDIDMVAENENSGPQEGDDVVSQGNMNDMSKGAGVETTSPIGERLKGFISSFNPFSGGVKEGMDICFAETFRYQEGGRDCSSN